MKNSPSQQILHYRPSNRVAWSKFLPLLGQTIVMAAAGSVGLYYALGFGLYMIVVAPLILGLLTIGMMH